LLTREHRGDGEQANAPLNAIIRPTAEAKEGSFENERSGAPFGHNNQSHDCDDEEGDVQDASENFNHLQRSSREYVEEHRQCKDSPHE
jgi:hypothetical protein